MLHLLYATIIQSFVPRRQVKEPHHRIALDTAIALRAEDAGMRLGPAMVHRVERVIDCCLALCDVPDHAWSAPSGRSPSSVASSRRQP